MRPALTRLLASSSVGAVALTGLTLLAPTAAQATTGPTTSCDATSCTATFGYTGSLGTFTVPDHVTSVVVTAYGGRGGNADWNGWGGNGGQVSGTLAVTPAQQLTVLAGPAGSLGGGANFGGGAAPGQGQSSPAAGSGGGGSFVFAASGDPLIAAGGGGGAQEQHNGGAGAGAATSGGAGWGGWDGSFWVNAATGGSQSAGGAGGYTTFNGSVYQGYGANGSGPAASNAPGNGGRGTNDANLWDQGAGGGGGYYGGGGGGLYGGGAGGSGFADASLTAVTSADGVNGGNGAVTFTWARHAPAVALSVSPTPDATSTDPVSLAAVVTGTSGLATGTVAFTDGISAISGCAAVALDGNGQATCDTTLPAGTHALTAAYSGDLNYAPGQDTTTGYPVYAPLAISTSGLPDATFATSYSTTLGSTGGKGPFTWDVVSGTLPAGLSLSTAGVLSGTPTAATTSPATFRVSVTDDRGTTTESDLSLVVDKAAQSVAFTSPVPTVAVRDTYVPTFSSGDSGNPVILSVDPSTTNAACSVTGGTVTFDHPGTCVLDADQAGTADYGTAATGQQQIGVGQAAQALNFTSAAPTAATVDGASYTPAAEGGLSGQPVTYSVDPATTNDACTLTNGDVAFGHAGTCVLDADQAGTADYTAAPTATQQFDVNPGDQVIGFTSTAPAATVGGATYTPTADGGASGQPVTFSVDPSTTDSACSITNGEVTFDHAGTCVVAADQTGTADYNAAPTATQAVTVGKGAQAITFTSLAPADATVGGSYAVTAVGGNSMEPVVLTVDPATTNNACTIANETISFDHAGSCVVAADQATNVDYTAAPTATQQIGVGLNGTTTSLALPAGGVVTGQGATAAVAVTGAHAGSVRFTVDGVAVGSAVPLSPTGTATELVGADLAVGSHPIGAVFTPADTNRYAGSTAVPETLTVGRAATTATLAVHGADVTAHVTPTAPGAGAPTGTVRFYVAGVQVGSAPLTGGTAALGYRLPTGSAQNVAAVYAGDSGFTGSSASTARRDPVVTATLSSSRATHHGWYTSPVTVTFHCRQTTAALAGACPAPITLAASAAGQSVTRTVLASDGGAATVVATGINIDSVRPVARVVGVRSGATYFATAPPAGCRASDALSGVASCRVTRRTIGDRVVYLATATDVAGNRSSSRVVARTTTVAVSGAPMRAGHYVVHLGHTYTVLVAAATQPTYVFAAPTPGHPAGIGPAFKRVGTNRWALGVTFTRSMSHSTWWNIGTRVGSRTTVTTVRVVR